jgi:hypothetical protein
MPCNAAKRAQRRGGLLAQLSLSLSQSKSLVLSLSG